MTPTKLKSHWGWSIHPLEKTKLWLLGIFFAWNICLFCHYRFSRFTFLDFFTWMVKVMVTTWFESIFWKFDSLLILLPACKAFSEPSPRAPGRFWPPPCRATAPGHGERVQQHRFQPRTEESVRLRDQKDPTATTLRRLTRIHTPKKWWNLIAWWILISCVWISDEVPWRQEKCGCIEN